MDSKQRLVLGILDFLTDAIKDGSAKQDDVEGLEVAIQCIGEAFNVDPNDQAQRERLSIRPATLQSIFDVYMKTREKMGAQPASSSAAPSTSTSKAPPSAEEKARAEGFKQEGNALMSKKSYKEAIEAYNKAVESDPFNPVYYSNRAAAHSSLEDHYSAIEDAQKAIEVDPKFSKAYSRMGHAYYCVEDYDNAVDAYKKGLELDPNNAAMKTGLESSKSRIKASSAASAATETPPVGGAGGMPDLASMMSALGGLGGGGGGGGGGGMPDLGSLMNNPAIMSMAQQMMGNGGLERMMSNPAIRNLADRVQSGGQMPSMAELMSDPSMQEAARNMMGGAGRGAGGPGNV
ncbi:hypothetical protein FRC02_008036 [Tulasnella sp. 418]|nr:hypothetical protein FRC02_008036 [Tulasnella sp. 418]